MKHKLLAIGKIVFVGAMLMLASCAPTLTSAQTIPPTKVASAVSASAQPTPPSKNPGVAPDAGGAKFTMEQTLSDQAELTTIAFDGLAITHPKARFCTQPRLPYRRFPRPISCSAIRPKSFCPHHRQARVNQRRNLGIRRVIGLAAE